MSPLWFSSRLPEDAAELKAAQTLTPILNARGHPVQWERSGRLSLPRRRRRSGSLRVHFGWEGFGDRDLAVVTTASPTQADEFLRQHPYACLALFSEEARNRVIDRNHGRDERVEHWPFPIPEAYYAPGEGAEVHRITRELRLSHRPRLVYAGRYEDGAGLTRLLEVCRTVLSHDGELILLNGLARRAALAPVVQSLRLAERVIFAPPLAEPDTAAIFHTADLLIDPDRHTAYPYWLSYAQAAGLPTVATDTPWARETSGRAALLVDPDRPDAWPNAVNEALAKERLRETMIERAFAFAASRQPEPVAARWCQTLARWEKP